MEDKSNIPIVDRSFALALEIVKFSIELRSQSFYHLSSQVFKSGTSIGANIREAQGAESKADFIHKMKIAFKESEELDYWLELTRASIGLPNPNPKIGSLLLEIRKLLSSIISSSKKNL